MLNFIPLLCLVLNKKKKFLKIMVIKYLHDGHISQRSPKSNARFVFTQSGKPEKNEYFNLVLSLMLPFCTTGYVP